MGRVPKAGQIGAAVLAKTPRGEGGQAVWLWQGLALAPGRPLALAPGRTLAVAPLWGMLGQAALVLTPDRLPVVLWAVAGKLWAEGPCAPTAAGCR